jgi:hypothetical protein
MNGKVCIKCKEHKDFNLFSKCTRSKDGKQFTCKGCMKSYRDNMPQEVKDIKSLKNKKYYEKNKQLCINRSCEWKLENREMLKSRYSSTIKNYNKKYYEKNKKSPDKIKYNNDYKMKNKKEISLKKTLYRKNNREEINKYQRIYFTKRLREDIQFKLACNLRGRFKQALKRGSKKGSVLKYLGCSINHLKDHLESKFTEGMCWDNWGLHGWHIDHIIPMSKFDLTNEDDLNIVCHYSNLQPLWAIDNIKKGNKY